jgi:hypothetical protein
MRSTVATDAQDQQHYKKRKLKKSQNITMTEKSVKDELLQYTVLKENEASVTK